MTKKKPTHGGRRIGAGRPALYSGPRVLLTVSVTREARQLITQTARALASEHGAAFGTTSAAVEHLLRRAWGRSVDD